LVSNKKEKIKRGMSIDDRFGVREIAYDFSFLFLSLSLSFF